MKLFALCAAVALSSCVNDPGYQARRQRIQDAFDQLGNSVAQAANAIAPAAATYAQGYSQAYNAYQPQHSPWHSGTIITPGAGTSFYNYNSQTGLGSVITPSQGVTFISGN
jgi:hypothetical protein